MNRATRAIELRGGPRDGDKRLIDCLRPGVPDALGIGRSPEGRYVHARQLCEGPVGAKRLHVYEWTVDQ